MIQIRNSCFETNSSSSHSVCISMDFEVDPSLYELINDEKLYIYPRNDGFSNFKTNKCLDKLQFLVSLVCDDVSTVHGSKEVKHLRTLLKNAIGVSDVYIGHIDEYYEKLRQRNKKPFDNELEYNVFLMNNFKLPKLFMAETKTLKEEIFETSETLRSFIISPNSWLYVPSDISKYKNTLNGYGSTEIEKFECEKYYTSKETDSVVSINYTPDLSVDIEVSLMNDYRNFRNLDLKTVLKRYDEFGLTNNIHLKDNELVYYGDCDRVLVEVIADKYYLIQVFRKKNMTEQDQVASFGQCRVIEHNTNYELPRFKGSPFDAEECKTYRIDIKSDKFFGDLIL